MFTDAARRIGVALPCTFGREAARPADHRDRPPEEERTMSVTVSRRRIALASALGGLLIAAALYGLSWEGSARAAGTTTIVFAESGLGTEGQQTAEGDQGVREGQPVDQGDDRRAVAELDDLPAAAPAALHRRLEHARRVRVRRHLSGQVRARRLDQAADLAAPEHGPVLRDRGRRRHLQGRSLRDAVVRQPGGPVLPDRPDQDAADLAGAGRLRRPGGDEGGQVAQGGPRLRGRQVRGRDHRVHDRRRARSAAS